MYITIDNEQSLALHLVDNSSSRALVEALKQGAITYEAHDYGNCEKVGPLGRTFPTNDEPVTTEPGDVILYRGSNLCLYYDTNTWDFTRIGRIEGHTQASLKRAFKAGQGNISVTLSLTAAAAKAAAAAALDVSRDSAVDLGDVNTILEHILSE